MFDSLRVRASQGTQYITDLRKAVPRGFRGRPRIAAAPCDAGCDACVASCPTSAITLDPVRLDLGRCVFCAECVEACPTGKIAFTEEPRMGGATTIKPRHPATRVSQKGTKMSRLPRILEVVYSR